MTKKVFLIDDDDDDRELFSEALTEVDDSVIFYYAADGENALEKIASKSVDTPDIIFLDINLPAMTGWQCLDKLKRLEASKNVPVIMYSTSSHARDRNIARSLGALCLITKPHDYKQIKHVLSTVITNINLGDLDAVCKQLEDITG